MTDIGFRLEAGKRRAAQALAPHEVRKSEGKKVGIDR